MLLSLTLADFVLVDRLSLDFHAGFSALTGETGAGKSILLDALSLVLGERADAALVRAGAERADISAEFDASALPHALAWLRDNDLSGEDGQVLLRRVVEAGGRSRAFINGRPATAQQLKTVGEWLVDIHGQHAHYSLLKTAEQRRLLDAYAQAAPLADAVAVAWRDWRAAAERRGEAERAGGAWAAEQAECAAAAAELEALAFTAEGWQAVQDEQRRLAHAAELIQGAQTVVEALDDEAAGALARLREARHRLAELADIDPDLRAGLGALEDADAALRETARELSRYAERVELDPEALQLAESRIAAVQAAARKHHVRPEELPTVRARALARLAELGEAADVQALARLEAEAEAVWRARAAQLGAVRAAAAARLNAAVSAAMQQLAMSGGRFEVALAPCEPAAHGAEDIEFRVSPHAGQGLQALAKTASGGELSRIGLALQTVLSAVSGAPTLIFDEVDAGIGGGVAEIVGRLLAEQGQSRQVLCVTHLPQVAARAAHHYRVSKQARDDGAVYSRVAALDADARIEEIARMLGGVKITATTREHARELLRG